MTGFTEHLDRYVAERRRYGGNWTSQAKQVRPFAAFADREGAERITTELFLRWKDRFGSAGRQTWAVRLSAVRSFAVRMQGFYPNAEVPPRGLIPNRGQRPTPYIHSDEEVRRIVAEAEGLECSTGLRAATCSAMFGLMAVTGMRVGETVGLPGGDVDTATAVVRIRHARKGRGRVIPVASCTAERLRAYRDTRDRVLGCTAEAFFCGAGGRRLSSNTARGSFAIVGRRIGLREPQDPNGTGRGPRLHDLRHSFATKTIIDRFRQGRDINVEMYRLSACLGHAGPDCTWWYIGAVPELPALACDRADPAFGAGRRI